MAGLSWSKKSLSAAVTDHAHALPGSGPQADFLASGSTVGMMQGQIWLCDSDCVTWNRQYDTVSGAHLMALV